jgi:hypothetical protein
VHATCRRRMTPKDCQHHQLERQIEANSIEGRRGRGTFLTVSWPARATARGRSARGRRCRRRRPGSAGPWAPPARRRRHCWRPGRPPRPPPLPSSPPPPPAGRAAASPPRPSRRPCGGWRWPEKLLVGKEERAVMEGGVLRAKERENRVRAGYT